MLNGQIVAAVNGTAAVLIIIAVGALLYGIRKLSRHS
jgi:hypothetical protein